MKSVEIKISSPENVKEFVKIVSRCAYDIDLREGRHVVDAKSILGIFSLDLSKSLLLEIFSDDCKDLLNKLRPFLC